MIADAFSNPLSPRRGLRFLLSTTFVLGLGLTLAGCKTGEERAAEYYQSGLQFLQQGDTDRAIVQFRNVFNEEGTHYEARKALADTLRQKGDTQQAYSQYLRLAEQYPDDLSARIALAQIAFETQNVQEFDRHTASAIEIAPQDPAVAVLRLTRDFRDAVVNEDDAERDRLANEAVRLAADHPDDPMLLGILLDRAARSGDLDEADRLTALMLKLQPDNPQRYSQRLALLVERGDMSAIETHLHATVQKFPDNVQAKADMIRFYMSQNQPDKAEEFLRQQAAAAPADDPTARAELVRFIELQRGTDAARAELDRILAEGGDPLMFGTLRASFDFREGRQAESVAEIRRIVDNSGEPTDTTRNVRIQLARMMLEMGDAAGARQQTDEVLAQNPSHPGALKLRANWDILEDRPDDAVLSLREVLDQSPDDIEAMSLMADAYDRAGEPDLAREYLSQAMIASGNAAPETLRFASRLMSEDRWRLAEDAILPALRVAPQDLDLLGTLGQVYLSMPDLPRAEGVIKRLREIGTPEATTIAERLDLNRLASEDGDVAAITYLQQQADAANAGTGAKLELIRAQLATGQSAAALRMAQELARTEPDSRPARMALGMAQAANADMAASQATFRALIQEEPADLPPYLALIRMATQQGDMNGALTLTEQALTAAPDDTELLWTKAGLIERTGDIDGAIAIYEDLYARDSSSIVIANNLASLLATWKSDDPAALTRASAVARRLKDTQVPAFMDTYGWIQHLNGDSDAALPYLEAAAAALTDDPVVQLHLGVVQAAVGKTDAAKIQLEKGLAMLPEGQEGQSISVARAMLAQLNGQNAQEGAGTGTGQARN